VKNNSRANRRHHQRRLKNKRRKYWGGEQDKVATGKKYTTPKPQCVCCSNIRKREGPTLKERQNTINDQLKDYMIEGTFVCSRCSGVCVDKDRCELTGECIYCY